MAKRKKWVQVIWIVVSIMIGFTMILFTAGGALLTGGKGKF